MEWIYYLPISLGVLFQTFLLLDISDWSKSDWLKLITVCIFSGVIGLLPGKEVSYDIKIHILLSLVLFVMSLAWAFKERIIPTITERTLTIVNLCTLYLVFRADYPRWVNIAFLVPTTFVLLNALIEIIPRRSAQIAFFAWYFILVIIVPAAHFNYIEFSKLFFVGSLSTLDKQQMFFLGMTFAFVLVHLSFLLNLIPSRRKHESWEAARDRHRKYMSFLDERFSERQLSVKEAFVLILITGGILEANFFFNFISDSYILFFIFIASSILGRFEFRGKMQDIAGV